MSGDCLQLEINIIQYDPIRILKKKNNRILKNVRMFSLETNKTRIFYVGNFNVMMISFVFIEVSF